MNKLITQHIALLVFFFLISTNLAFGKIKSEIIYKIDQEIITNIDIENEVKFLLFLNPNLAGLNKNKIEQIARNSLKNRKIKEIELFKYFDLTKKNIGDEFIQNFLKNSNYDKKNLLNKLSKINLQYAYFENNLIIDNIWRQFIYNKFKSQVKLNNNDLKNQIRNKKTKIEELNLSEILFELKPNEDYNDLISKIYSEIDKSGFEAAASIFSIAESKNFGGKLGWIKSNQISAKIYKEIIKAKKITKPIKTNNGYLILKVNEKREINQIIDFEEELKKLINIETNKQINKFGYIYFNKIKKRIFISEN